MNDLKNKHIAVIGVTDNPDKYGHKIFRDLLDAGFNVSGVHVLGKDVLGKKIHKKLFDIVDKPDLVITVVPPQVTEKIVKECIELGIKEIWMQPGSESEAAIKEAKSHGISVVFNACFMVAKGIW